jgi:hypothetical protein
MVGPGSLDRVNSVVVGEAPDYHPGLEALWRTTDRSLDDIRFKAFY